MKFQTILADPPWHYADQRKIRKDGKTPTRGIGACHHYAQMTTDELCSIRPPVQGVAAERCHLYLWATCPLLPEALKVMEAWEFKWATVIFVWVKANPGQWRRMLNRCFLAPDIGELLDSLTTFNPGFYTGSNVELVLLGTRGQPFRHAKGHKASQVVYAPRLGHSQKPDEVQRRITWMYPGAAPRLEMFGRRGLDGWTVIGNEAPDTLGEDIRESLLNLADT